MPRLTGQRVKRGNNVADQSRGFEHGRKAGDYWGLAYLGTSPIRDSAVRDQGSRHGVSAGGAQRLVAGYSIPGLSPNVRHPVCIPRTSAARRFGGSPRARALVRSWARRPPSLRLRRHGSVRGKQERPSAELRAASHSGRLSSRTRRTGHWSKA